MPIDFTKERWEKIKEDYGLWWTGQLKRPLIQICLGGHDPGRPEPTLPYHGFTAFYDFSVSPEAIVDRWDYSLSCYKFIGDTFPSITPNFGPGVIAAFLGAILNKGESTCWFHPVKIEEIADLRFQYVSDNVWFNRTKDIYRAAIDRWDGLVQIAMTDLGGNCDILSTFRPGEKLLLDLYDYPQEVKRLTWEAHNVWWRYFDEINNILQPMNPGYTAWARIFSKEPYYMLQCDFSYMISPDMFDEFVKPEIVASCQKLNNAFYHLDGPGQLPHLDSILEIKELKGVQWAPGAGQLDYTEWPEVYKKIRDAGKLIQTWGDMKTLDTLVEQIGSGEGIIIFSDAYSSEENNAIEFLKKYNAI